MSRTLKRSIHPQIHQWLEAKQLPHIAALADHIQQPKMHCYRVLGNDAKHSHLIGLMKVCHFAFDCSIDDFAHHVLDFSNGHALKWIGSQMLKSGIPSTRQLGIRAGIDLAQAQDIVNGKYQYIQLRTYRTIARGLGVNLGDLLAVLLEGKPEVKLLKPLRPRDTMSPAQSNETAAYSFMLNKIYSLAA
jgi:DNA-binding Xre family transcriptional regulator